ncbi:RNA polymerase sigma factor [Sphingobacterium lactis]|uniref:RNA polymerase sigma factor n=1 Tax=Sphingobacterium lactis TaxID=797291 RepID=UPI003DA42EDE
MPTNYLIYSDEELFDFVIQNNEQAFVTLYNRYKRPLVDFALNKLDAEEVEDIIHDLFTKLWVNRSEIKINTLFKSYIYKSLRNRIVDFIAHQVNEKKYLDSLAFFGEHIFEQTDYSIREKQFLNELNRLIDKYNPNEKEILRLRMEGYSNQEIADILHLSEKTVRNKYSLIIKDLQGKIKVLSAIFFF